jgi:hypothetical protein
MPSTYAVSCHMEIKNVPEWFGKRCSSACHGEDDGTKRGNIYCVGVSCNIHVIAPAIISYPDACAGKSPRKYYI